MIQLSDTFERFYSCLQWSDDLLKVSAVLLGAALLILVVFSAQLFLIYQIEKRHLGRRDRPHADWIGRQSR
jgi:hypothetical protein